MPIVNKGGFPLTEERKNKINAFSGWGGCNAMILPIDKDWKKAGYSKEYLKVEKEVKKGYKFLQNIFGKSLTDNILEDIKNATLTSFYTPANIPDSFFKELKVQNPEKRLEFLDPCAGSGVYIDACLEHFPNAQITAVEKDFLTSFLLKAKYKEISNVTLHSTGFENVKFGNKKFDVIASNIPFGDFKISYPQYDKIFTDKIHNFFFHHSQNLLKEDGILSFITSTGVFNSAENKPIRENLLNEGTITNFKILPNNTFENTSVASHIVTFVKRKEEEPKLDQNLFLETKFDEKEVRLNTFISQNKEQVYLAEPTLQKNQYGKFEYISKSADFQKDIEKLEADWKDTDLKINTLFSKNQIKELIFHDYPVKSVSSLNTKQTNLIEEIQYIRKGEIPNGMTDFSIIASIKAKKDTENIVPLVTIATGIDKINNRKVYYFQSDIKDFSFTEKEEQWISTDIQKSVQDILANIQNISQEYQMPIQLDFKKNASGIAFQKYFAENYKQVPLEYAYTKNINFHFHRTIQEGDIFVTQKGNIAQISEIQEIIPNVNSEFPEKSEQYKVRQIEILPENKEKIVSLLKLYSVYNEMIQHHHQFLNGTEWSLAHLEENKAKLNAAYDNFVKDFGQINSNSNRKLLNEYKDLFKNYQYVLTSLEINVEEKIDPELPLEGDNIRVTYQKSGIFNYDYKKEFNQELSVENALVKSFSLYQKIDIDFIVKASKKEIDQVLLELEDVIIFNPLNKEYELKENFLKGNIYDKKEQIEALPDSAFKEEALSLINAYFPDRKPFHSIVYQMGSRWIPIEIYKDFLENHFDTKFKIAYSQETDDLYIEPISGTINKDKWHRKKMGNGRFFDTIDIIENAFYNTTYEVKKSEKYYDSDGKEKSRSITLYEDTAECKRHIENLRQHFMKYMRSISTEKQEQLTEIYNRKFNIANSI